MLLYVFKKFIKWMSEIIGEEIEKEDEKEEEEEGE